MRIEGRRRFEDDDDHVALVCRTLRTSEDTWRALVTRWCASTPADASLALRLETLREAAGVAFGEQTCPPRTAPCVVCGATSRCVVATDALSLGRCEACGHGQLLHGASDSSVYTTAAYYSARTAQGAGYERYRQEQVYRERKGEALLTRLFERRQRTPQRLLEVGSGFGFTLAAARRLGLSVQGIDVNPAAAEGARALTGVETFVGTSSDWLAAHPTSRFDVVLYQFVLEHLADLRGELHRARALLSPGGLLIAVVPSAEATELEVFRSRYRSLREDHLHLFSARSVARLLSDASFVERVLETTCNLHLLRGFLSTDELEALYGSGAGPDVVISATRPP